LRKNLTAGTRRTLDPIGRLSGERDACGCRSQPDLFGDARPARFANQAAALSTREFGAVAGLPQRQEVEAFLRS
jgi:sugar/nucleoside kinase (ribokinase family)